MATPAGRPQLNITPKRLVSTSPSPTGAQSGSQLSAGTKIGAVIAPSAGPALKSFHDANFPRDGDGRVYHLGVLQGEVANRILSVGSETRAAVIASFLDAPDRTFVKRSSRGFVTYTGTRNGVPVSIIVTGMGTSMMDFVVRETRAVVEGPMAIVRYGTCGSPSTAVALGSIAVATEGSVMIQTNYDAFGTHNPMYTVSRPVLPDTELSDNLVRKMREVFGEKVVVPGLNATADSFYSSQGRHDPHFEDRNSELVDHVVSQFPSLTTLEMETYHLLYLAKASRQSVRAAASTMVIAQRRSNEFLDKATIMRMEREGGRAALDALVELPLSGTMSRGVWNA